MENGESNMAGPLASMNSLKRWEGKAFQGDIIYSANAWLPTDSAPLFWLLSMPSFWWKKNLLFNSNKKRSCLKMHSSIFCPWSWTSLFMLQFVDDKNFFSSQNLISNFNWLQIYLSFPHRWTKEPKTNPAIKLWICTSYQWESFNVRIAS